MSKALLGAHADTRTLAMLDQIRHLRARVEELEAALERADEAARTLELEREHDAIVLETTTA